MFSVAPAAVTLQCRMKYIFNILLALFFVLFVSISVQAQCSVCTKTSSQMGEKPAQGMNSAILYLMVAPFAIVGFIGYRWWKGNKKFEEQERAGN
jgi:hypothetical protein